MADKSLPTGKLPRNEKPNASSSERRRFLKRAAVVGVPVLLASVPARPAWATGTTTKMSAGCKASASPSGCANRTKTLW
jgi:hypothetical protein